MIKEIIFEKRGAKVSLNSNAVKCRSYIIFKKKNYIKKLQEGETNHVLILCCCYYY